MLARWQVASLKNRGWQSRIDSGFKYPVGRQRGVPRRNSGRRNRPLDSQLRGIPSTFELVVRIPVAADGINVKRGLAEIESVGDAWRNPQPLRIVRSQFDEVRAAQ